MGCAVVIGAEHLAYMRSMRLDANFAQELVQLLPTIRRVRARFGGGSAPVRAIPE